MLLEGLGKFGWDKNVSIVNASAKRVIVHI
jgi:hypothetical protein